MKFILKAGLFVSAAHHVLKSRPLLQIELREAAKEAQTQLKPEELTLAISALRSEMGVHLPSGIYIELL